MSAQSSGQTQAKQGGKQDRAATRLYEMAKRAEETRKSAPKAFVQAITADELRSKVRDYAPECVVRVDENGRKVQPEWHAFWAPVKKVDYYANRAYFPVLNEGSLVKTADGEMVLMKCRQDHYQELIENPGRESRKRLSGMLDEVSHMKADRHMAGLVNEEKSVTRGDPDEGG